MAPPALQTSRIMPLSRWDALGSSPTNGSSMRMSRGSCSHAAMIASFCFMPCEYAAMGCARSLVRSNESPSRRMRSARTSAGMQKMSAMKFRYRMPVMKSYRSGLSGMYASCRLHVSGSSRMEVPQTVISPLSNGRMPVTAFRVVVLPAPLCPMKPQISPGAMCSDRSSTAFLSP